MIVGDFYDEGPNSTQLDPSSGLPFGFFQYPLRGYVDGYPVLIDSHLNAQRAIEVLTYLKDGDYLNQKWTKSMSLQACARGGWGRGLG